MREWRVNGKRFLRTCALTKHVGILAAAQRERARVFPRPFDASPSLGGY